jgi:hypothetical protein
LTFGGISRAGVDVTIKKFCRFDYNTGGNMETIDTIMDRSEYNRKCADAVRTLKIFIRNAEEQLSTSLPISTLKLIIEQTEE